MPGKTSQFITKWIFTKVNIYTSSIQQGISFTHYPYFVYCTIFISTQEYAQWPTKRQIFLVIDVSTAYFIYFGGANSKTMLISFCGM